MPDQTSFNTGISVNMHYRNAVDAIEWICRVFGFQKHAVYPGEGNIIMHSELTLGSGLIMVSSMPDNEWGRLVKHPADIGGAETCSVNLTVADADAVYERAKAAGAEMLFDIEDKHYGGRGFSCRDLEGHIWSVGTYDPWAAKRK